MKCCYYTMKRTETEKKGKIKRQKERKELLVSTTMLFEFHRKVAADGSLPFALWSRAEQNRISLLLQTWCRYLVQCLGNWFFLHCLPWFGSFPLFRESFGWWSPDCFASTCSCSLRLHPKVLHRWPRRLEAPPGRAIPIVWSKVNVKVHIISSRCKIVVSIFVVFGLCRCWFVCKWHFFQARFFGWSCLVESSCSTLAIHSLE